MLEAINFLSGWISWMMVIVPVGAGTMVTYQAFRKSISENEAVINECNTKIKNTIIGAIVAITISGLVTVIKSFYM